MNLSGIIQNENLVIENDTVVMINLPQNKLLDDREELRRYGLEVFVEIPLDGKARKYVVINQRGPQVRQNTCDNYKNRSVWKLIRPKFDLKKPNLL